MDLDQVVPAHPVLEDLLQQPPLHAGLAVPAVPAVNAGPPPPMVPAPEVEAPEVEPEVVSPPARGPRGSA